MAVIRPEECRPKKQTKGKVVRFADHEGHSLCEVFHINCSNNCNVEGLDQNATARQKLGGKTKPRNVSKSRQLAPVMMPWNSERFYDRLELSNVSLENVVKTRRGIIGMVAVKNLAYLKDVIIRYSFDNWATTLETHAAFYRQDRRQTDFFVFVLASKAACFDRRWEVKFAIRYRVNGKEFWDNNDGSNYGIFSD
eukprot:Seg1010.5 transcript_id=Seg1010.5/GoldUCD/mRNA.D3Y31 product="Protein phosphatase 1 regulatory subunit 3E" protein_id=Seg1010.5/GoldUCD/D3Y31